MEHNGDQKDKPAIIRTPDYRLRVFISSTLKELAEEREAARQAIINLRLMPIMFESGARSHPSHELYRAFFRRVTFSLVSTGKVTDGFRKANRSQGWKMSFFSLQIFRV